LVRVAASAPWYAWRKARSRKRPKRARYGGPMFFEIESRR